ncbi:MAG TPA: alpha/beta hydrolase [Noviherbaspirillum sp.]|uniref:alpha/beta hydrolase n=1 Tax=Noviherbaspirillum sp. TaxID=1926288 RepID=UPI002B485E95|nr:alpha/beta hydrolase [Noviherbaspirillum sp.]HJV83887.1 alpha/beta hydrolase [Noviherbaspirillum sp.]
MLDFREIANQSTRKTCLAIFFALTTLLAHAGQLVKLPTRPDITTNIFWEAHGGAKATVFLFPGGGGGFGKVEDGRPTSRNFLVRTVPNFLENGFNVAIFGKSSDLDKLDYPDRISEAHMTDIHAALDYVKTQSAAPIWLVGTSRGTISATAAAIHIHDPAIAGLVLTSSVVSYKKVGAVPTQDLAAIRMPVLVMHHTLDACNVCFPSGVPAILDGLTNAPVKKQIMVSGGANPSGNSCEALHWHGFIGMEKEAVDTISGWIKQPSNQ